MKKQKKIYGMLLAAMVMSLSATVSAAEQEEITEYSEGDMDYIYANEAVKSELNTCQISINGMIPEGMVNAYVIIMNMDSDKMYQAPLTAQNGYMERFYVPAGSYRVIKMAFYDDNAMQYPFIPVDDFTLEDGENITLEAKPVNYDEIAAELEEKRMDQQKELCELCGDSLDEEGFCRNPDCINYPAEDEEEIMVYPKVKSDIEVTYEGNHPVALGITGTPTAEAHVIVKIVKEGNAGNAYFQVSYDNGNTWSEDILIPLSAKLDMDYGMEFEFAGETFYTGDIFRAFYEDPTKALTYNTRKNSSSEYVTLTSSEGYAYDVMIANDLSIAIQIRKDGSAGVGVFAYSLDGGNTFSEEYLIPEDGIFRISEYDIIIHFNPDYKFYETSEDILITAKAEKGLNYFGIGALLAALIAGWSVFKSYLMKKKTPNNIYNLNKYRPYKEGGKQE